MAFVFSTDRSYNEGNVHIYLNKPLKGIDRPFKAKEGVENAQ